MTPRQKAARKAARTRAVNRAEWKRYYEVDKPTNQRIDNLLNRLLKIKPISVRWNPLQQTGVRARLKNGAIYGDLLSVQHGGKYWTVKPEGYKHPQQFHAGFWEPLLP